MRFLSKLFATVLFSLGLASTALAQTYPTTTPVYIPSAIEGPTTCTAACDVYFNVANTHTITVQLIGSPSAITATVRGTNQPVTTAAASVIWTPLSMVPVPNGGTAVSTVSALTTSGIWSVNAASLTRVNVHITALTGTVTVAMTGSNAAPQDSYLADPCYNPLVSKSSVALTISTATTTQLVALSAGKSIYVCNVSASMMGTTPAFTLEYGTGSSCGTGTTALTGAYAPTAGSLLTVGGTGSVVVMAPAGNALCAVSGGTTPNIQGILTYVQQ